jgi:glycosyltransferase involved in cell wall biosynthesis
VSADEIPPTAAVAVVVPVRNGARSLGRLLDALAAQDITEPWALVIVDNASTDDTAEVAMGHPLRPRVVREEQPGSYAARNAGIAATSEPVLAFTDGDCAPHPGWLRAGLAAIRSGADLVGGEIHQSLSSRPSAAERYDARHYLNQRETVERSGHAATANLFVRREVFDDVGPFDAELASGGDLELCYRARRGGHTLVYEPGAVVDHVPRRTLRETWRLRLRLYEGIHDIERRHPEVVRELRASSTRPWAKPAEPALGRAALLRRRLTFLAPYAVHRLARREAARRARRNDREPPPP